MKQVFSSFSFYNMFFQNTALCSWYFFSIVLYLLYVFEAFVIAISSKQELLFNVSSSVSKASSTPHRDLSELSQPATEVTIL